MAFSYYKSATIDHTQCGTSDSTDFPVTIWLTDADLKTVGNGGYAQNANGYDIRPYSDSGLTTPLTFELVNYNASNGTIEMFVKIPTLSHSADTVFYLAFGDAGVNTDGSSTSTWNANFAGVYHFGSAGSLSANDSTSNAVNGTNNGVSANAGYVVGGAGSFDGTDDFIDLGTQPNYGPITVSCWFNTSDVTNFGTIICDADATVSRGQTGLFVGTDLNSHALEYFGYYPGGSNFREAASPTNSISINTWYQGVYTDDGNNTNTSGSVFINGVRQTVSRANIGSPGIPANNPVCMGKVGTPSLDIFVGLLDEVRRSFVILSDDWILSEYNNQVSGSTFIGWGSKVALALTNTQIKILSSTRLNIQSSTKIKLGSF